VLLVCFIISLVPDVHGFIDIVWMRCLESLGSNLDQEGHILFVLFQRVENLPLADASDLHFRNSANRGRPPLFEKYPDLAEVTPLVKVTDLGHHVRGQDFNHSILDKEHFLCVFVLNTDKVLWHVDIGLQVTNDVQDKL
jgi:hypothetical protein